ncbi:MAG: glycosyltransferase [Chloroflexi bacterium]|nr:glycosyltransferase [Chloroflexota bacterium]
MLFIEIIYFLSTALLAVYGIHALFNTVVYLRNRDKPAAKTTTTPESEALDLAFVTVQLPVYNERHVVNRLIEAVAHLDWPADRLQIQVLDDSSDDTVQMVAEVVARLRRNGTRIEHVRRPDRVGYKAGALTYGMQTAKGEYIAIFDADFVPPPDFLHRTLPSFSDPAIGCVQTRWGHLNPEVSHLTRAQALGIDGHFTVEQHARNSLGAFLNFNGTAGIWRRSCMEQVGGWQGDTLTEDLDLSYRAQLQGWRITYLPYIEVPAELPVQIDAFKRQQFRWAKGSIQTAKKLGISLWRAPQPLWRKALGTLHLTGYLAHFLMLLNLVLLLPVMFIRSPFLWLTGVFSVAAIGPPLLYWVTMQTRLPASVSKTTRLARLGILVAMGTGLAINNTKAVLEALTGRESAFKRTPKFAVTNKGSAWQTSSYTLPRGPTAWLELVLAIYAVSLLIYGLSVGMWWMFLWLMMYASGFSYMAYLSFAQAFQLNATRSTHRLSSIVSSENS